jgi:hypothetical protein
MTWENNGRNQCKLVVISKFWLGFWLYRDFGSMANWSTHLCTYPIIICCDDLLFK